MAQKNKNASRVQWKASPLHLEMIQKIKARDGLVFTSAVIEKAIETLYAADKTSSVKNKKPG